MAKFCTECGKEIAAGVAFCTECGAKAPADPAPQTVETVTEVKAEPKVEVKTEAAVHTPPAPTYQAQQTYSRPVQPVYAPPAPAAPDPTNKVVGTGLYFLLMFLFAIPIIGFIACLIMAFAPKNRNLKNYARAMLIWSIIALVIFGLLIALIFALTNSIADIIGQIGDGQLGDIFGQFGEIGDTMNELGSMTEQLNNGGLSSLPLE